MQRLRTITSAFVIITILFLTLPQGAFAQSLSTGSGLSLSPTISEYTLTPNQSKTVSITLKNVTTGDISAQAQVEDFISNGTSGTPEIVGTPTSRTPNSIKNFVGTIYDTLLTPNEQKVVSVTLTIPPGTPPGAYFGIIRFKAVPAGQNAPNPSQVALTASVGTIVLITVPGNLRQQVQFTSIHVYHGNTDGWFFVGQPQKVGVEIKNLGNGFAKPFGTVEIQNMFGKEVANYQFNNPSQLGNVLPSSTRIFANNISSIKAPGRYTILASVAYDSSSGVLTLRKTIWYVPLWLLLAILVVVAAVAFFIVRSVRYQKQRSRHSRRRDE